MSYAPKPRVMHADAKGRIALGAAFADKLFRVTGTDEGNLVLEPVEAVHEREAWLYRNPEALASVRRGIKQSKSCKGEYLGSFAKFADDEIED